MGNAQYGIVIDSVDSINEDYQRMFVLIQRYCKVENGRISIENLKELKRIIWTMEEKREETPELVELTRLFSKHFNKEDFDAKIEKMDRNNDKYIDVREWGPIRTVRKNRRRSLFLGQPPPVATGIDPEKQFPKVEKFSEPQTTVVGTCMSKWADTIFHPTCACYLIILIAIISAVVIGNIRISDLQQSKCPSLEEKYIWEPKIGHYGKLSHMSKSATNQTIIDKDCLDTTIDNEYSGILYGVIQATMVFMLTMTLGTGLTKYKEEIRLFEALAGDVKAMAMFMVHLTYDSEKYNRGPDQKLQWKPDVEKQFEKIRVLLAVITPVARVVLKGKRLESGCIGWWCRKYEIEAKVTELETHKNYIKIPKGEKNTFPLRFFACWDERSCCGIWKSCFNCGCRCPSNWWCSLKYRRWKFKWSEYEINNQALVTDYDRKKIKELKLNIVFPSGVDERGYWASYQLQLEKHAPTTYEISLYKKIYKIQEESGLDLFETLMTVLLDEIIKVSENELGFGKDEGSAVMSAVYTKWDSIYAAWGEMASIKSYREPLVVHLYRAVMLGVYAVFVPYNYSIQLDSDTSMNIFDSTFPYSYFAYIIADVAFFSIMWSIAYSIRNPFKDVKFMRGVKPIASATQHQILNLMKGQARFDNLDYGDWWNKADRIDFPGVRIPGPPPNPPPMRRRRRGLNF